MEKKTLTILIIDDHDLFRTGLNLILMKDDSISSVLEAGSVMLALEHSKAKQAVDLILLDIQMPGLNGLDGIKVLKESFRKTPIIMLSASHEASDMDYALKLGADGFLDKSSSATLILDSITKVVNGGQCFPENKDLESTSAEHDESSAPSLTSRQLQVLSLMCEGKPNKIIARDLGLSENTVRVHVSAILGLLGVSSRSEAIMVSQKQRIIRMDT